MDSAYRIMLYLNWLPILIFAVILITIRMGQAADLGQRELDPAAPRNPRISAPACLR